MRYLIPFLIACVALVAMPVEAQDAPIGYRKVCNGRRCWFEPIFQTQPQASIQSDTSLQAARLKAITRYNDQYQAESPDATITPFPLLEPTDYSVIPSSPPALAVGDAAHTPMSEVVRVINLLPKPQVAFVDYGCGYDARWCVAAAERWGCKCVGVEIDHQRAHAARERIRNLGLAHLVTIQEGDASEVPVSGDVAVAYLYPTVLSRLSPRLKGYRAFASYIHQPPGMNSVKNGDTWIYQPSQVQGAVWDGAVYSGRLCNNPNCAMCNSIQRQLGY